MKHPLIVIIPVAIIFKLNAQACEHLAFKKGQLMKWKIMTKEIRKQVPLKHRERSNHSRIKTEAVIHTESYNKKDEKESENDVKFICDGDKLIIDISSMMKNNKDMEVKMESSSIEIPSTLTAGHTLPDATLIMKIVDKKSGQEFATTTICITNRKVEGKESVTTPASTFDTRKLSYNMKMETKLSMGMTMPGRTMKNGKLLQQRNRRNKVSGILRKRRSLLLFYFDKIF